MSTPLSKADRRRAKKMLELPPGPYKEFPVPEHLKAMGFLSAYVNNRYKVSLAMQPRADGHHYLKLLVSRVDGKPIPNHWAELQKIKNHFLGEEVTAVEYYPAQRNLIDLDNIYWLWVIPELPVF